MVSLIAESKRSAELQRAGWRAARSVRHSFEGDIGLLSDHQRIIRVGTLGLVTFLLSGEDESSAPPLFEKQLRVSGCSEDLARFITWGMFEVPNEEGNSLWDRVITNQHVLPGDRGPGIVSRGQRDVYIDQERLISDLLEGPTYLFPASVESS